MISCCDPEIRRHFLFFSELHISFVDIKRTNEVTKAKHPRHAPKNELYIPFFLFSVRMYSPIFFGNFMHLSPTCPHPRPARWFRRLFSVECVCSPRSPTVRTRGPDSPPPASTRKAPPPGSTWLCTTCLLEIKPISQEFTL